MTYTPEQHIGLRRVVGLTASPCGSWLAVTVQRLDRDGAKYVSDIWKVPADGGAAMQLTRGDSKDHAPAFRQDGALAFLSDRRPNEIEADEESQKRMQVWVLPAGGGEPTQLTDEPLGVLDFHFARRAPRLVLLAPVIAGLEIDQQREVAAQRAKRGPSARRFRHQPVRHWDSWLHQNPDLAQAHLIAYDDQGGGRTDLTPEARSEFAIEPQFDVSADGAWVVITRQSLGADRELDTSLLLIEIATGARTNLGVAQNSNVESPVFSPDGTSIAALFSTRSPDVAVRPLLGLLERDSGAMRAIGTQWDRWPGAPIWAGDGRTVLFAADDAGHAPVFSLDVASGVVLRISATASGGTHSALEILPDGRIAAIRSTLLDAPECVLFDPRPESDARPLARLSGFAGAGDWARVETLLIASNDGTPIHTLLVRPKSGADGAAAPLPLLFWIHGGPIGMNQDGWHWRWNPLLLVARGYAVALPNPRGSSGFGQHFIQGIWGNVWGDQCYRDLMAVADALCARADMDASRTMAMGGSFGGYMTNWIGTQTDRFRCLISHAGIATMAQFTGTTDHPGWWYLEMGGEDPYDDREHFDRYAPIRYVKNWKTPVLIIHGERDYRCPIGEALNLFEALQYHKVESELLVFPDENHWILKPRNILAWYEAVQEFIARYLR